MVGQQFVGVGIFIVLIVVLFAALGQLDLGQLGNAARTFAEISAALATGN